MKIGDCYSLFEDATLRLSRMRRNMKKRARTIAGLVNSAESKEGSPTTYHRASFIVCSRSLSIGSRDLRLLRARHARSCVMLPAEQRGKVK